jgi:solute carrier family 35 protein E3
MPSFDEPEKDIEMSKTGLLQDETKASSNGQPAKKGARTGIVDGACILLNIASTVVLVFLNKWCVDLETVIMAMDSFGS